MSISRFNYSKTYTVQISEKIEEGQMIYFKEEETILQGKLSDDVLETTQETASLMVTRLFKNTKKLLNFMKKVPEKIVTDEHEVKLRPSSGDVSLMTIPGSFKICRQFLVISTSRGLSTITLRHTLSFFISLLSILPQSKMFIIAFIRSVSPQALIIKEGEHFIGGLYNIFYDNNHSVRNEVPKEAEKELKEYLVKKDIDLSKEEIQYYISLLTLYMSKNTGDFGNYTKWESARRKAWNGTLKMILRDNVFLRYELMRDFRSAIDHLPTLKGTVINILLANKDLPGIRHTLDMLIFTQSTMLLFVETFIQAVPKTYAHVDLNVLEEMGQYSRHITSLKEKYGDDWKYFKLYEPNNNMFSSKTMPHLSFVSFWYAHENHRTNNYTYGEFPSNATYLKTLVEKKLKVRIETMTGYENYPEALALMGITSEEIKAALSRKDRYDD